MSLEWEDLSKRAAALEDLGRHQEAILHLAAALAHAPDNDRLLCTLAYNHWRLGEFVQAQAYADRAIGANPNNEWAYRLRCSSLRRQRRWCRNGRTVLQDAKDAVRLSPEGRLSWHTLADTQLSGGQLAEAARSAERLREIAPDWALTYDMLARVAHRQRRKADAEAYVREALRLDPLSSSAMNLLGVILFSRVEYEEGIEACYRAVQRNPQDKSLRDDFFRLASRFCSPATCGDKIGALLVWAGLVVACYLSDRNREHLSVARALDATAYLAAITGVIGLVLWGISEGKTRPLRLRRLSAEVQHAYLTERKRRRSLAWRRLRPPRSPSVPKHINTKTPGGRVSFP